MEGNGGFAFISEWVSIITYCEWNNNKKAHTKKKKVGENKE